MSSYYWGLNSSSFLYGNDVNSWYTTATNTTHPSLPPGSSDDLYFNNYDNTAISRVYLDTTYNNIYTNSYCSEVKLRAGTAGTFWRAFNISVDGGITNACEITDVGYILPGSYNLSSSIRGNLSILAQKAFNGTSTLNASTSGLGDILLVTATEDTASGGKLNISVTGSTTNGRVVIHSLTISFLNLVLYKN
jgi:hypothetical protein